MKFEVDIKISFEADDKELNNCLIKENITIDQFKQVNSDRLKEFLIEELDEDSGYSNCSIDVKFV